MAFPLSDAGFPPTSWGSHAWTMVHLAAAAYPPQPTLSDKAAYRAFYESLQHVLPCPGCREGYTRILKELVPLTDSALADRMALFKWTVDVHNAVNAKLGKRVDNDVLRWYVMYNAMRL